MRIVLVWVVAISLIFMVTVGWWISQPLVLGVSRSINSSVTTSQGRNVVTAIEYVSYAWGPILIVFVLLWAVVSSSRYDVESEVYA